MIVKNVVENGQVRPDVHTLDGLINAWSISSQPDAVDQAFGIKKWMEEDPRLNLLGISPTALTYNKLLKVLSKNPGENGLNGERAIELLNEMERRFELGEKEFRPNYVTFNLVIKTNLNAGKLEDAEKLLDRMENSGFPPDKRTYAEIVIYWAQNGIPQYSYNTLQHMKKLSYSGKPELHPDIYIYNMVISAWYKSQLPRAQEEALKVFDEMIEDRMEPNIITYTILIPFLSKSRNLFLLQKADDLLAMLEKSENLRADSRHYHSLIRGWVNVDNPRAAENVLMRCFQYKIEDPCDELIDMIMRSYVNNRHYIKATAFLENLAEMKDSGEIPEGPIFRSYEFLYEEWERTNHAEKGPMLQKIMDRMKTMKPPQYWLVKPETRFEKERMKKHR
jgi:pentatricopeptide repeat protein